MRHLPTIAGALLGLLFLMASGTYFLGLVPEQAPPPEGSPTALFMGAFAPTGYMTFVKVIELLGGVLVAIPRTRNLGLLLLGPVIVNIAAFHLFVTAGEGLFAPMLLAIYVLSLYLLWHERRAWAGLVGVRRSS
jgi:putative oxidoreductase